MDNQEKSVPNEFAKYLEEALFVMKAVLENVDKKPLNPDVSLEKMVAELMQIEKQIDSFIDVNKDTLDQAKQESDAKANYSKETIRLLKKTEILQDQAEKKREWLVEKKAKLEAKEKSLKTDKDKDTDKAETKAATKTPSQKSKFRRLGKNPKWKPL